MINFITIFFISLYCITLELFLTRILNLKTWNHVVYIIIPFSILGYGIGANLYLILANKLKQMKKEVLLSRLLFLLSFFSIASTLAIIHMPIRVSHVVNIFSDIHSILYLLLAYTVMLFPFVLIGFLVVYLFALTPKRTHQLYFVDLLGAGLGAYLFFPLIESLEVFHSILACALVAFILAIRIGTVRRRNLWTLLGVSAALVVFLLVPEPVHYAIDPAKGWEWIPGFHQPHQYKTVLNKWHPLGRTDVYQITDSQVMADMYHKNVTFMVNLEPPPEFSYFTSDFLAGTPVFHLAEEGLQKFPSKVRLFSQPIEVPYLLVQQPRTLIIGTGGGRDIFMANLHGAREVYGAEINSATYDAMAPGGVLYDYSGQVYGGANTHIENVDGRHMVKTSQPGSFDLIVLNGVDTFSGLSTGAYAYSESYLYTKDALKDYLRILNDQGLINFNRHLFAKRPRETLRLQAIAFAALKDLGVAEPWNHVCIGGHGNWSIILIKKSPFDSAQQKKVAAYFAEQGTRLLYAPDQSLTDQTMETNYFETYAQAYQQGKQEEFARAYPFDISVITDDNPFFYKYYKFKSFHPKKIYRSHHTGTVIFLTQILAFLQAIVFILIFIFVPLFIFKLKQLKTLSLGHTAAFIAYFCCLGLGFMFLEIPLMQRFTLFFGSPIYSISVTLAVLLISTGIGSMLIPVFKRLSRHYIVIIAGCLLGYVLLFELFWPYYFNRFIGLAFQMRILLATVLLAPFGVFLGVFFPSGLMLIKEDQKELIAWAWGLNCGFSVLGSILSIIIAQFLGFSFVIRVACGIYALAVLMWRQLVLSTR
jgi:spermidine synthase